MKSVRGSFLLGFEWPANSHRDVVEGGELQTTADFGMGKQLPWSWGWWGQSGRGGIVVVTAVFCCMGLEC